MSSPFKTVAFHTLGCKLNFSESSSISRDFTDFGYSKVSFYDSADVYVVNTCSVTDNADKRARKIVRQILNRSPEAYIAMIGCYAQLKPDEISCIEGVNLILGAHEKFNLPKQIEKYWDSNSTIVKNEEIDIPLEFKPSFSIGDRTRTFLKIQDGCDYPCTYCTIPLARGKSRFGTVDEVTGLVNEIATSDVEEIVLTGVNIGEFGKGKKYNFLTLLKALDQIDGISRYRISSIEPNLLTNEIIDFVAKSNKILPHFHIPLQSGSDKILKLMKRRYGTELYSDRVEYIRERIPNACIGADVIVGFPDETDDDFNQTYTFLHELDVNYFHVFTYSERENTEALHIENSIPLSIRSERSKILHILSEKKRVEFREKNLNTTNQVLFENEEDGVLSGLTENYIRVNVNGDASLVNTINPVAINEMKNAELFGELVL